MVACAAGKCGWEEIEDVKVALATLCARHMNVILTSLAFVSLITLLRRRLTLLYDDA
jgi:hypothetical protein